MATKPKSTNTYRTFFIDDEGGNKLQIKQNDTLIILTLLLLNDKPRRIGRVTKSTRTIEITRKRGVHLFRKGNAYGFNHYVLNNQTSVDWVRLSDDTGSHWKIKVDWMMDKNNGFFLQFSKQGFELQKFFSLSELEQWKVLPEENRRF